MDATDSYSQRPEEDHEVVVNVAVQCVVLNGKGFEVQSGI
jgi:hypothetical protein